MNWHTKYTVVYEDDAIRLLCFKTGEGTPILIVPPQAGHKSWIADYGDGQSIIQVAMEGTASVYCIGWKACTHERRNETIDDLIEQVRKAVSEIIYVDRIYPHLVGLCQGGWLAALYAMRYPLAELTIANAPLDTSVGKTIIQSLIDLPLWMHKTAVERTGGIIRGSDMLMMWKSHNWGKHFVDEYILSTPKKEKFYSWYNDTQDISGAWPIEITENLFKGNQLATGGMGDLNNITCPVNLIGSENDDITPPEQVFGFNPAWPTKRILIPKTGHIGGFMGRKSMPYWRPVLVKPILP
jgi:poly(3-hydroxyalkanoate) synthetase